MGTCSLYYTLSLHISCLDVLQEIFCVLSLLSCAIAILFIIISFFTSVFHRHSEPIISSLEYKVVEAITLGLFMCYTISFLIRGEIAGWERGSEVYMSAMIPVILPVLSGAVVSVAHRLTNS